MVIRRSEEYTIGDEDNATFHVHIELPDGGQSVSHSNARAPVIPGVVDHDATMDSQRRRFPQKNDVGVRFMLQALAVMNGMSADQARRTLKLRSSDVDRPMLIPRRRHIAVLHPVTKWGL